MTREKVRLVLVVAPSKMECHRAAQEFGLDFLKVDRMRFIDNPYHLRGWSRGTAFITFNRRQWSTDNGIALDQALDALTANGHLRIANERDLDELRSDVPAGIAAGAAHGTCGARA